MSRIYLYIAVLVLAMLVGSLYNSLQAKKDELQKLHNSIQCFNKAQKETADTITQIREVVKYVYKEEDCNCYNAAIPDDILNKLYKQR